MLETMINLSHSILIGIHSTFNIVGTVGYDGSTQIWIFWRQLVEHSTNRVVDCTTNWMVDRLVD